MSNCWRRRCGRWFRLKKRWNLREKASGVKGCPFFWQTTYSLLGNRSNCSFNRSIIRSLRAISRLPDSVLGPFISGTPCTETMLWRTYSFLSEKSTSCQRKAISSPRRIPVNSASISGKYKSVPWAAVSIFRMSASAYTFG